MSQQRSVVHTFLFMASLTLISKTLGFLRELIMANYFGASYIVDAYVMAVAIPGILFGGIFGGIATSYIPMFSKINEEEGVSESNKFTNHVINLLIFFSLFVISIGVLFSDQIQSIFASGFTGETARLTSFYLKITFSYVLFTSTAGILDAFLQYNGVYLKPIISIYFQNIAIIGTLIFCAYSNHTYIAFGMLFGALLRLVFMSFSAKKEGFCYKPDWSLNGPIRGILSMAVPVFIGTYILQINSFVDKTLASGLPEGSVAALNYGMTLIALITGLTVSLMVTLIYPMITRAHAKGDFDEYNRIVKKGINIITIITIPFTLGILTFSDKVVQVVFERGAFDPFASTLTAGAFAFYGAGLVFFSLNEFLNRIFYSMRNTRAPIVCSGISVIINIVLNLLLIDEMAHRGLAFATSISALVNTILLFIWIKKKYPEIQLIESYKKTLLVIVAAAFAVLLATLFYTMLQNLIWMPRIVYLFLTFCIAVFAYLIILKNFKMDEILLLKRAFKK